MTELPPADRFAPRGDSPYWNESAWFSFSIPERRIHGLLQYYFRPNMGMLNGGPAMWDPSGTFQWNCLYYNWSHLQALPEGAQKYDMTARNSLTVKLIEPLKRYTISYDKDGFVMDLDWEALCEMHEIKSGDPSRFHIEQPGRMRGTITRHGEVFPIDCLSMRDASHGKRDYESMGSGAYFWGMAENSAFHAIANGEGREQVARGGAGFIWKDGKMSSIERGVREVLEYGSHGPSLVRYTATDRLGRSMIATGKIDPGLIFTGYTDHTVVWSLIEWDWDGVTHWGDNQEYCPDDRFRRIARGELQLG